MDRSRLDQKTLWNIAAVAVIVMIVLAIGVFIGKTLTMNTSGNTVSTDRPSVTPGAGYGEFTLPSENATALPTPLPTVSATSTPSPTANTVTATTSPTRTSSPTPTATPTATPTPTPRPSATATPSPTPTPTPTPISEIQDTPFYESITPLKDKDQFSLAPVENSYIAGNGPLYLDLDNSYMGSGFAYPGDTIGVRLRIKNDGPAMNKPALVTMNLSRMVSTPYGSYWVDDIINQQFTTQIDAGESSFFTKNISYTVPNMSGINGFYKIYVRFYVYGKFNAGFVKELNILE